MTPTTMNAGAHRAVDLPDASLRAQWPAMRPALIFHLITRVAVTVGLLIAARLSGRAFSSVVTRWDGRWYNKLAVHGYPSPLPTGPSGHVLQNTAGFFPVFPMLTRALMAIGIPYWLGGMMINLVASSIAVLLIVAVGLRYLPQRAATLLGCLWTAYPVSVVLSTTYTESIFTVFGAAALLFAFQRRWLLAGLMAALAGAVRSPGIVFAGAVGLAALEAIIRRREWRSLLAVIIAPLGFLAAITSIGLQTGRMDAWQVTERDGWHARLTFGKGWLHYLQGRPPGPHGQLHQLTAGFAIVLVILVIATVLLRPPLMITGLVAAGAVMTFIFGGVQMNAAPRVMMSFFPVLAPPAVLMARWPAVLRWALLTVGAVVAAVVGGYYFAFAPISL